MTSTHVSASASNTVPIGLVGVADALSRQSDRKQELLAHEIAAREAQYIAIHETRKLLSWHPMRAVKRIVFYGLNAFGMAWALGSIASLMSYYVSLNSIASNLSLNGLARGVFGAGTPAPSASMLSQLSNLPSLSMTDSIAIGCAVALLVAIEHAIVAALHGKRARTLQDVEHTLQEELRVLRMWFKE
jgi:hypothetical protein